MESLRKAEELSSNETEKLNIRLVVAGYLIHAGQREEGLRRFESIKGKLPVDSFSIKLAWFYAVADRKQEFYDALECALRTRPQETMLWIDQEVDIEKYRKEERFKTLVAKYSRK